MVFPHFRPIFVPYTCLKICSFDLSRFYTYIREKLGNIEGTFIGSSRSKLPHSQRDETRRSAETRNTVVFVSDFY
jgi:hypothetical protein